MCQFAKYFDVVDGVAVDYMQLANSSLNYGWTHNSVARTGTVEHCMICN